MFHMWVIIGAIFFVCTFQGIYSLILYLFSDSECIVQHDSPILQSIVEIFARSTTNVVWLFPIIWLFWPH